MCFFLVNSEGVPKVLLFSFVKGEWKRRKDPCTQEQWILQEQELVVLSFLDPGMGGDSVIFLFQNLM